MMDEVDEVAILIPCEFCGAESTEWCVTRKSGAPALYLHNARTSPAWNLYQYGRRQGREFYRDVVVDFIDHHLPTVVVQGQGDSRWVSVKEALKIRDRVARL